MRLDFFNQIHFLRCLLRKIKMYPLSSAPAPAMALNVSATAGAPLPALMKLIGTLISAISAALLAVEILAVATP